MPDEVVGCIGCAGLIGIIIALLFVASSCSQMLDLDNGPDPSDPNVCMYEEPIPHYDYCF